MHVVILLSRTRRRSLQGHRRLCWFLLFQKRRLHLLRCIRLGLRVLHPVHRGLFRPFQLLEVQLRLLWADDAAVVHDAHECDGRVYCESVFPDEVRANICPRASQAGFALDEVSATKSKSRMCITHMHSNCTPALDHTARHAQECPHNLVRGVSPVVEIELHVVDTKVEKTSSCRTGACLAAPRGARRTTQSNPDSSCTVSAASSAAHGSSSSMAVACSADYARYGR